VKTVFLLRFQEDCIGEATDTVLSGTQTLTGINAEQIDSDPTRCGSMNVFPEISLAGTATTTNVDAEGVDQDPNKDDLSIFPL
jgi:hypothetical protein